MRAVACGVLNIDPNTQPPSTEPATAVKHNLNTPTADSPDKPNHLKTLENETPNSSEFRCH
ncbi:hypothetical protein GCM10009854_34450 [Saccharopolyspora halophila]|uniref:Uncharacterized protein n=1 Tax=Saccharopolyspora halophila TaxID=405551 RepID=A0ABP5TID5_9PSEU